MKTINLIFPNQLFQDNPLFLNAGAFYIVEEYLFFKKFNFHKQKLALHRASMKFYESFLLKNNKEVIYIEAQNKLCNIRLLIAYLKEKGISEINILDPADNWLERRMETAALKAGIKINMFSTPLFLNSKEELKVYFTEKKKKFFQTDFYISERKKRKILVNDRGEPDGGKWSFDAENRKKYPAKKMPPKIIYPEVNEFYKEAKKYVEENFRNNPGELTATCLYPNNFKDAGEWMDNFFKERFEEFGIYEDAIVSEENILHHSRLTPILNIGLITPKQIISKALSSYQKQNIPLNSAEGFIRQIIGWREFMRGVYIYIGSKERTCNFWNFKRKMPASFYSGTTGIIPIDQTIKKVLQTGYCHHIERLMLLGNFMLLCEIDPDEVYKWFMEMFIDAYDWVMVPNIYGMSQFADGGLMSTKPYISGSNYILKMSDYKKSNWQEVWDGLFWRFMHVHRSFFLQNPRLGMLIKSFDTMENEKKKSHLNTATKYLSDLDKLLL